MKDQLSSDISGLLGSPRLPGAKLPQISVVVEPPVRLRLTPRLTTNGPVATGEQVAAYSMARWISEHCAWTGDSFISGLEVSTSVDVITGRSSVKLGVILDVQPRDPAEVPDVIGAEGRLNLNVISHFDMSEFEAERRPAHELLPLFFRNAILDALEHEADECISVDGERTFDPHAVDRGLRRHPFRSVHARSGDQFPPPPSPRLTQERMTDLGDVDVWKLPKDATILDVSGLSKLLAKGHGR